MNKIRWRYPLGVGLVVGLSVAGYLTQDKWLPMLDHRQAVVDKDVSSESAESATPNETILLTDQAIDNLGLTAKRTLPDTYWRTIQIPGTVVDRPGRSDLGVVSPVSGVVTQVNCFPGNIVRVGDVLFSIRLLSESLHATQSDLFKATQDIKIAQAQRKRLSASTGAIAEARIIEAENQITRLEIAVRAYRQELLTRGLSRMQIDEVAEGNFVRDITVVVPDRPVTDPPVAMLVSESSADTQSLAYEVQELDVELGQQVNAGQTLCMLANHRTLDIEGRAFPDETPLLERTVREGWPVDVDFGQDEREGWPPLDQTYRIRHLANTIDPTNRTFAFRIPLENQSKVVEANGQRQMLWRCRPGQKLRILVRVQKLDDVFVLPADAVTRDGAEAFVFTQNVNTFERKPVRILFQNRRDVVLANDGSLVPGMFVVQNAAAQLNRMTKSQSGDDLPEGYHIHADGSLHKNEDEGK
ncbi:hypothetical protein Pan216_04250 [Planctomycetes bacterium Pan216]|uniref:HlyD family secretion protein n=2 Tax=Kolteria novifilia TaxID=2527975 RepID=A0A518AY08_9BACT|nr:hypothetical protein Pan216_04250 [Planctomycetes bacterium Pan216]